jgi:hypothetical protein
MIIKSLLFIIICIFVYETFNTLNKITEEYFSSMESSKHEKFIEIGNDPEKNSIARTIGINCKTYPDRLNRIMAYKPDNNESLDTPYYSQFKSLKYNPDRKYYWNVRKLIHEGIRRSKDDDKEIEIVQKLYDGETDEDKKQLYKNELNIFRFKKNILAVQDKDSKLDRSMRNITTDYFPEEIGMSRPWRERHSHIKDYSY